MNLLKLTRTPDFAWGRMLLTIRGWYHFIFYYFRYPELAKLCLRLIPRYTMVKIPVLVWYHRLASDIVQRGIKGDIVECGVWNGGSAAVLAHPFRADMADRKIWLFDSFRGVPAPTPPDGSYLNKYYFEGWCTGDVNSTKRALQIIGMSESKINIVPGWFKDTFEQTTINHVAILHIDADLYEPVKLCLEKWYDRVVPGGYIILNDYSQWGGCQLAVKNFESERGLALEIHQPSGTGAWILKS